MVNFKEQSINKLIIIAINQIHVILIYKGTKAFTHIYRERMRWYNKSYHNLSNTNNSDLISRFYFRQIKITYKGIIH